MSEQDTATQTADTTQTDTTAADQPSFIETLGDEFKGNEAFTGIEDAKSLASKFVEQGKTLSDLQANLPKPPESADKYTEVAIPEGVIAPDDLKTAFKELSHELGFTDDQYQKIVSFEYEAIKARNDLIAKQNKETMEAMKKEMGDKFDENVLSANKILSAIPELKTLMGEADPSGEHAIIRTNPNWFKALVSLGQKIQVDRLVDTHHATKSGPERGVDGGPMLNYPSMKK